MSEIIQKWVTQRTGLVVNMSPELFASDVRDGTILARVLHSYNIIGKDEFISIVPTVNEQVAYKNFQRLSIWLQAAGVEYSQDSLLEIASGRGFSAIKLFYQLYLALHDKDKLHFITSKRINERLHAGDKRFDIRHVPEEIPDLSKGPDHPLSEPLLIQRDVIQWNQERYMELLDDYEANREEYSRYIREKFGTIYRDKFSKVCFKSSEVVFKSENLNEKFEIPQECTYEELAEQEEHVQQTKPFQEDPKVAKRIVNTIKRKHRKEIRENELKLYQQRRLLLQVWEKQVAAQEKEFEEIVSRKMMKQSQYEKQMATKMFEVRQQKENILQNRRFLDDEIVKKREEEFLDHVFVRQKIIDNQKYAYYFERDRALELHRRLYAEKMRLKAERHYNMCKDAVKDLVDVSIRHSEYKESFDEEPSKRVKHEWANLFIKQQPIFDIMKDVEDIVQNLDDLPENLEEMFCMEIERQDELDERDFENYHCFEWPWELKELSVDYEEDLCLIELGMNVLGFDVHRVLLIKYPKPKPPPPPNIPKVTIAACVNGLNDLTILPVLQKLLHEKKVKVVQMEDAVNYCLEVFKEEIRTEYVDNVLMQETEAALAEMDETKKKGKQDKKKPGKGKETPKKGEKTKGDKKAKKSEPDENEPVGPAFVDKQNQTPRIYPCEEIVLSPAGELGKVAYDLLNTGEPLTDVLVVAMFIEYLKTLEHIKGWALVNFPTTLPQAVLLEEALTGIPIPEFSDQARLNMSVSIGDVADLNYRESQWLKEEENAIRRRSKLLPNPVPPREEPYYDTYLTAFINSKPKTEAEEQLHRDKVKAGEENEEEQDVPDPLETFYMDQGCIYNFFYKTFELATVKHLAKLIIGEYTIPPKASLELFGDTVTYIEANLGQNAATVGKESKSEKKGEKKEKPKPKEKKEAPSQEAKSAKGKEKGKADSKAGKGKKGSEPVVEIVAVAREDKETQIPEPEPEVEEVYEEPPPEPRAGEPSWQYSDIHFPDYFQIALASLWENEEDVYVCDLKELFFIKRIILNAVMPYLTQIRRHMEEFIRRPDDKQTHLYQFQKVYNEIDADLREDEELKAEVHCRIAEFREKLWEICDKRMRESEEERQRIIQQNWVSLQICELTNNYISAMQLEIDRCCESFQFLTDYYTGVITKMPSEEPLLQKTTLTKIVSRSTNSVMSLADDLKSSISEILIVRESESTSTPFHESLTQTVQVCLGIVNKWKTSAEGAVAKMDVIFKPTTAGKKDKPKKEPKSAGKKDKNDKKLPKFMEPEPDVKEAGTRLIEEWHCAVNGEFLRVKMRLNLLEERGKRDLNDVLNSAKRIFHGLFDAIYQRYHNEIGSVDKACEVLGRAVEAEISLQPELVLVDDKFYVDSNVLLFPEPLPPPEPPIVEKFEEGVFTISQLDVLSNILIELAPKASVPERVFIYLLQDMIVQNAEDGSDSMVPESWKELKPDQVSLLSRKLFGDVEFLDWRDFVIYNLCIDFPTEEELLETRRKFREVDPDATEVAKDFHFYGIEFWFERNFSPEDVQDMLRLRLIKQQLFKLFKVDNETINYTAMLLSFCKDDDPIKGFAKGLSLALGKPVCWDAVIGETFVDGVLTQRRIQEQQELERQIRRQEAIDRCESVVDTLIDTTVHVCDSVVIEDYVPEEAIEESTIREERLRSRTVSSIDIEFAHLARSDQGEGALVYRSTLMGEEQSRESLLMEEEFSNIEIGFEPDYNPPKAYFLPFEVLLTVSTAALPWHSRAQTLNDQSFRQKIEELYESLKNPLFNDSVLTHQLLNDYNFIRLFLSNFKFTVKRPPEIVAKLISK